MNISRDMREKMMSKYMEGFIAGKKTRLIPAEIFKEYSDREVLDFFYLLGQSIKSKMSPEHVFHTIFRILPEDIRMTKEYVLETALHWLNCSKSEIDDATYDLQRALIRYEKMVNKYKGVEIMNDPCGACKCKGDLKYCLSCDCEFKSHWAMQELLSVMGELREVLTSRNSGSDSRVIDGFFRLMEKKQQKGVLSKWIQAVGILSTLKPDMEINVEDPIGMAKQVESEVSALKAAIWLEQHKNRRALLWIETIIHAANLAGQSLNTSPGGTQESKKEVAAILQPILDDLLDMNIPNALETLNQVKVNLPNTDRSMGKVVSIE